MSRSSPPRVSLPAVDDRLIAPESRFEIIDGKLEYVPPAHEPHGTRHSEVCALLEAHVVEDYDVACDMLTRTSEQSDFAPDASVFPIERDPATGGRRLEELAFEILSSERLKHAAEKARALSARGVRKVFAIDVEKKRVLVWSVATNAWEMVPTSGAIVDPAFAVPLPIAALAGAAQADDAVARALLARKHPVIETALEEREARGHEAGKVQGKIEGILVVLRARGLKAQPALLQQLRARTDAELDALLGRALTCTSVDELLRRPLS
jgi:Uma2 family endonuclease